MKSVSVTHLEGDLQCVSGHLQDSSLRQLPGHAHPGVGCEHGASQLLAGNNQHVVGDHCQHTQTEVRETRRESSFEFKKKIKPPLIYH